MKKKIPIGVSEFREIREHNYYYLDKTNFITELLLDGAKVTLFTRPRRFGKTLNMTMLREFFDITKNTKHLFEGLEVEHSEFFQEINTFPTLFFSFRDCKGTKETMIQQMKLNLMNEYQRYLMIQQDLSKYEQKKYFDIYHELEDDVSSSVVHTGNAIVYLCKLLYQYYKKPVMLLIDEYDTPMVDAYVNHYYEELRDFFTTLYSGALKDNPYLAKGIVTGIQRVAKENIFSGLNNLKVCTVRDFQYRTMFGLTTQESQCLLEYYDLQLTKDVKEMYNGYVFGTEEIYNPWSMISYVDTKLLKPHWINTFSNALIRKLIQESSIDFKEDFELLILNQSTVVAVDTVTSFWEFKETKTLWGLLLNAGYITAEQGETQVLTAIRIPNREVKSEFQKIVSEYTKIEETSLLKMFYYLVEAFDLEKFKAVYQDIVLRNTSFYDAKENSYHMLFLGMSIFLDHDYEIHSNIESGKGRSDLILKSLNSHRYPNFIIEFKQGQDVMKLAREAILQIKKKQYGVNLEGSTILLGIAHNIKECEILSEVLEK